MKLSSSEFAQIIGNDIFDNENRGLEIQLMRGREERWVEIKGNLIYRNGGSGIFMAGNSFLRLQGNRIVHNGIPTRLLQHNGEMFLPTQIQFSRSYNGQNVPAVIENNEIRSSGSRTLIRSFGVHVTGIHHNNFLRDPKDPRAILMHFRELPAVEIAAESNYFGGFDRGRGVPRAVQSTSVSMAADPATTRSGTLRR